MNNYTWNFKFKFGSRFKSENRFVFSSLMMATN